MSMRERSFAARYSSNRRWLDRGGSGEGGKLLICNPPGGGLCCFYGTILALVVSEAFTAPGCPVAGEMPGWVAEAVEPLPGVKHVDVELVWEPPWGMDMMSDEARLELGFM